MFRVSFRVGPHQTPPPEPHQSTRSQSTPTRAEHQPAPTRAPPPELEPETQILGGNSVHECSGAGGLVGPGMGVWAGWWRGGARPEWGDPDLGPWPSLKVPFCEQNLSTMPTQNLGLRLRLALVGAGWCSALVALVGAPGALVGVLWWGCGPAGALAGG